MCRANAGPGQTLGDDAVTARQRRKHVLGQARIVEGRARFVIAHDEPGVMPVGERHRRDRTELAHLAVQRERVVAVEVSPRAECFRRCHRPSLGVTVRFLHGRCRMFINVPDESEVGEEVASWYDKQRASWGYLPNYAPAFATRPDVARAWTALSNAVGKGMDRRRFELATIAAARAYRSTYCMAAHLKFLRDDCGDEETMRVIAADPSGAALDPADKAVMDFATLVAQDASSITAEDVEESPQPRSE